MGSHIPVLLAEAIAGLDIKPQGIYVDATFGRGGHSQSILNALDAEGQLVAFDKDLQAVMHAKASITDSRFKIIHDSFANLEDWMTTHHLNKKVDGILVDLGVSSPQLDDATRGFSFIQEGPLDMRMNTTQGMTAADFVNESPKALMQEVFKTYGEERFAKRIAQAIEEARKLAPFVTTKQLADVVSAANPKWEKHKHPATRVFQAIRIYINRELEDLEQFLSQALNVLKPGGRIVVISFHSLEDRMVKQFFKQQAQGPVIPKGIPLRACDIEVKFKCIGKAIKASAFEVEQNVRARSAVLRIGEKLA